MALQGWGTRRLSEKCELCQEARPSKSVIDKVVDFEDVGKGERGKSFALNDFVAICDCYKKREDKGRVHYACLLNAVHSLDPETAEGSKPLTCSMCNKAYKIHVEERLSFEKLLSMQSLAKLARMLVYALMLACLVFCISTLQDEYDHNKLVVLLVVACGIGCLCLVSHSIYAMYRKFISSSSSLKVSSLA